MATRKIHFFTGKGGVGKSVVAASFALHHALNKSEKTLLAELSDESTLNKLIPFERGSVSTQNLFLQHWNANNCLAEYTTALLRSETLSKLFINNSVSRALINIAPGLQELAVLGKATSSPRKHGPQMDYSEIFIDSYASGHFVNLIAAPTAFAEMFSIGPMANQSRSINTWIQNSNFTQVNIVTLADELSVQESIELYKKLNDLNVSSSLILNKYINTDQMDLKNLPRLTNKYFSNIHEQQLWVISEFKKLKTSVTQIPFILKENSSQVVEALARSKDLKSYAI